MYQAQPHIVHALVADRMQQVRAELIWTRTRRSDRQHIRLRRKRRRRREAARTPIISVIEVR